LDYKQNLHGGATVKMKDARRALKKVANPTKAQFAQRFFKTGKGEYAEGDRFLGITVPSVRAIAVQFRELPRGEVAKLLRSPWHEERLLALVLLVCQFERGGPEVQEKIYRLYLRSSRYINNWDLVDSSAPQIVGRYLEKRSRAVLYRMARSRNLWERRIAILATFHFIRREEFAPTLKIAKILLKDDHDLIHKAVGWMLREVGKRDQAVEEKFLRLHAANMPRTMLRYAIEKFPPALRKHYLRGMPAVTQSNIALAPKVPHT